MSNVTLRNLQFDDLDQVIAEVQRLHDDGYTKLGNWSLGQCCNHLAQAMNMTVDQYSLRFPPPISTINRILFFKTMWAPQLLSKLSLPTLPGFGQTKPIDDTEGMNRLIDSAGRIRAARDAELKRHPLFGRLTKDQWNSFHVFHAQRHLGFLVPAKQAVHEERSSDQSKQESTAIHA